MCEFNHTSTSDVIYKGKKIQRDNESKKYCVTYGDVKLYASTISDAQRVINQVENDPSLSYLKKR